MPCNGLLISNSKHREPLLHASFSALICAKLDELIPFARHLIHWLFIGMAWDKNKQTNKKMSSRLLILITVKKRLTYVRIQLTLKFLGFFSQKTKALYPFPSWSPPPSLFNPSVHLPSPVWGEVKPDQLVEKRQCLSLDHRQSKRERERENEDVFRGGGRHHLLLTTAWQVILLNKGAHAQHVEERE